tara:strand:- start:243 stop:464 length:222 start_codon:yes stop_codon:yes gene_type:complete
MKLILTLSASVCFLLLSSCVGGVEGQFRSPFSGIVYDENGANVDDKTLRTLFGKIGRVVSGDNIREIILDPVK